MTIHPLLIRAMALAGLGATIALLLGAGTLLGSPGVVEPWPVPTADPLLTAVEIVRLATLVGAGWLFVLTSVDTIASGLRLNLLRSITLRLMPAFWRHAVLRPVATLAVIAPPVLAPAMLVAPAAAQEASAGAADHADHRSEPRDAPIITMRAHTDAVVERVVASDVPTLTMTVHRGGVDPVDLEPVDLDPDTRPSPGGDVYVVASGDNLWSIAAAHLTAARGERPAGEDVTPYWRALIDANVDVLPDPANPDLLFPGIQLRLPPAA